MSDLHLPFTTRHFPRNWSVRNLDEVCDEVIDGDWIEKKDQGGTNYRLIQISNIGQGNFVETNNFRFINQKTFDNLRCTEVKPGHILVARMPDPIGRAWCVKKMPWRMITAVDVAIVKPDPTKLDANYCAYYLNSPYNLSFALVHATGTTRPRITRRELVKFPIPIPPLPTQRKIAAILSAYDDLIENNTRRIQILEEMAQAIYQEWFVHYRFPGHEQVKLVDSGTELGMVPEGWEVKKIGDVIELAYGKGLKAENRVEGIYPVYGSGGIVGSHNDYLVKGPGIIVGRKGNVGSVFWSNEDFFPIDTVFYVVTDVCLHYVYFNLRSQNFINNDAAVPGLSRNQAYLLPFLIPKKELLDKFQQCIDPLFKQERTLRIMNENLQQSRDLLLPRLISGELDVSELEIPTT